MRTARSVAALLLLTLPAQAAAPAAFSPFAGHWTGTLEYKDYGGSSKHIRIPVKLEVRSATAGSAVWDFRYDDFGHEVQSLETHTWKAGLYTVTTKGKPDVQSYTSSDFAEGVMHLPDLVTQPRHPGMGNQWVPEKVEGAVDDHVRGSEFGSEFQPPPQPRHRHSFYGWIARHDRQPPEWAVDAEAAGEAFQLRPDAGRMGLPVAVQHEV